MRNFSSIVSLFFLSAVLPSCSHKEYPAGTYQETPVTADGELSEWNLPLRFGSSTGLVQYNITNDNENIYVSLQTHDDATGIKILKAGVNIYIDPSAGHSKKINLAFPLPASSTENNNGGKKEKINYNDMRQSLMIQATTFKTTGFENMDNRLYDVSDKSPIKVAIKYGADNSLGYEAVIPLKYVYPDNHYVKQKNTTLSVAVEINALTGKKENDGPGSRGGQGYNGSGMHGGGGGRRGGMGGGGYRSAGYSNTSSYNDRSGQNKADVNWYSFKLASR